ncbi:DUF5060 domain-containing protein [Bryocella elongata]|nr:DUF5060 domain-containing protein [Bryocella elongata]
MLIGMNMLNRREALKLGSAALGAAVVSSAGEAAALPVERSPEVARWEIFHYTVRGPAEGNPFVDVELKAAFRQGHREVEVTGFYDGAGVYMVRFMPDTVGEWSFTTRSNVKELDGRSGTFRVVEAKPGVHGPVRVANTHHFAYEDGTPYFPFGTTSYAWVHQSEALQEETLHTLKGAPFNKIRMCVFPKHYEYNHNEPPFYPFPHTGAKPGDADWKNDFTRFNPEFFEHIEHRLADLQALNIEADLILFHPYDRWGYQSMPADVDDRYLRYVLARFSAFRNVWWSMANEYDLMKAKRTSDFDRLFHIVEMEDPYAHLRSIHYSVVAYDYSRPWVTHGCMQSAKFDVATLYLADWRKPVLFDEVQYEGNLNKRWGNLSGDEMTRRFWLGVINGCYVTHGETLLDADSEMSENTTPTLWWSHGGTLKGTSPAQIAFLRRLVEESAKSSGGVVVRAGLEADAKPYYLNATAYEQDKKTARTILYFFDDHAPIWYEFPLPAGTFKAEYIDPMEMTITPVGGTHTGKATIRLSGKPFRGMRFTAV